MQRSSLTYSVDHTVLETMENAQRLFLGGGFDIRIKAEILNNQNNRSKAQVYGVGEIPLN